MNILFGSVRIQPLHPRNTKKYTQDELRPEILFLRGALALLFAGICVSGQVPNAFVLTFCAGAFLFADGVASLLLHAPLAGQEQSAAWSLLSGLFGIGVGTLTFLYPVDTGFLLSFLVGIWAITLGGLQVAGAFQGSASIKPGLRAFYAACGVAAISLGWLVLSHPWRAWTELLGLLSATAFVFGAAAIALGWEVRRGRMLATNAPAEEPKPSVYKRSA